MVPEGSAGIERTLVAYLKSAGKAAQDTSFDGRSDYDGFTLAGIRPAACSPGPRSRSPRSRPSCGAEPPTSRSIPTTAKTDTLDHIDRASLGINGGGVAYAVALYAQDIGGRNGVPDLADRTRHALGKP